MGILQDEIEGDIGAAPHCATCGAQHVVRDAWACWNPDTGLWEIETVFDQGFCQACETETRFVWKRVAAPRARRSGSSTTASGPPARATARSW